MPGSETAPTFRIADGLDQIRVWELVEAKATLVVECAACRRRSLWTPEFMQRRLRRLSGKRLVTLAIKLRCSACRSPYVRIWRQPAASTPQ